MQLINFATGPLKLSFVDITDALIRAFLLLHIFVNKTAANQPGRCMSDVEINDSQTFAVRSHFDLQLISSEIIGSFRKKRKINLFKKYSVI